MTPVFADTSYFLAILNPKDRDHAAARTLSLQSEVPIVTTVWVLTEVADALSRGANRALFELLFDDLRRDDRSTVIGADQPLWDRAAELFRRRSDKDWSLTDCLSFVVMEDYKLTDALTGDRHFEQAGFKALLRSRS